MKKFLSYVAVFVLGIFITVPLLGYVVGGGIIQNSEESAIGRAEIAGDMGSNMASDMDIAPMESGNHEIISYNQSFDTDKIIYNGNINLNVVSVQDTLDKITSYVEVNNGFVENSSTNNGDSREADLYFKSSYITIRIPKEQFNDAISSFKSFGEEIRTDIQSTNVSTAYYDLDNELNGLEIQEEKLLEYLNQAEKMEDLLTVETELNRVRTEINRLKTQLENYDRQIDYSTITVYLQEAQTLSTTVKSPFGQMTDKISKAFISSINLLLQSIEFLILFLFRILPFVIIFVPIGFLIRRRIRKNKQK